MRELQYYTPKLWIHGITKNHKIKFIKEKSNKDNYNRFNNEEGYGDFHLQPGDEELTIMCSEVINERLQAICRSVKTILENKCIEFNNCRVQKAQSKVYYHLYDYMHAELGNRKYELMGFRMAINHKREWVKCRLMELQFGVHTGNMQSYELYPASLDEGVYTSDISCNPNKNYYYNPYVNFYDTPETIAEAFIEFIEWDQKNIEKAQENEN